MNKFSAFAINNLSAFTLFILYLITVILHITSDGPDITDQLGLITIYLPFLLLGIALDYILRHNSTLERWLRIIVALLPLGIFLTQLISMILLTLGKETYDIFNYLIWLFIAAPFFIASYEKNIPRQRILRAGIATGAIVIAYLFLSTQTRELNSGYGSMIYYISYFMMLYTASGIKKLPWPYLGMVLGILNAAFLLLLRYVPMTGDARDYGWDYSIFGSVEMSIIITFVICIIVRVIEVSRNKSI